MVKMILFNMTFYFFQSHKGGGRQVKKNLLAQRIHPYDFILLVMGFWIPLLFVASLFTMISYSNASVTTLDRTVSIVSLIMTASTYLTV